MYTSVPPSSQLIAAPAAGDPSRRAHRSGSSAPLPVALRGDVAIAVVSRLGWTAGRFARLLWQQWPSLMTPFQHSWRAQATSTPWFGQQRSP